MWRFFATRLHGDGSETLVATEIPLQGARVHRALSGPGGVSGTVPVEVARLVDPVTGGSVFTEWATALYAEHNGAIAAAGILGDDSITAEGPSLALDAAGFSSYLDGMPYGGERSWVEADPADLVRHMWAHVQAQPGGNLGMVIDPTATPIRVGTPEREVEFSTGGGDDVSFVAGPYTLTWWGTHDLGREAADLASSTPFDWREEHTWSGEALTHRMRLGYPRLGTRRQDLRLVVGENVSVEPSVDRADYASEVIVLGSGEGRQMRRGVAGPHRSDRLRRPVTVVDKSLTSHGRCSAEAAAELSWRTGGEDVTSLTLIDHPSAPIGSWSPGDELFVQGSGQGWAGALQGWVRVVGDVVDVDAGTATLSVVRAGRA